MSIQFCVIREKATGFVLCNSFYYNEGYFYSEYTRQDPYSEVSRKFCSIESIYGPQDSAKEGETLVIFESRDKASAWLSLYYREDEHLYDVLSFAEIDAIVEATLLGTDV